MVILYASYLVKYHNPKFSELKNALPKSLELKSAKILINKEI